MDLNRRSRERGSATLVEFAFVLPVLLLFVFGIIEFSSAAYAFHFVSNAAREATRYASVRGSTYATPCSPPTVVFDCQIPIGDTTVIPGYVTGIAPTGINAGAIMTTPTWPGTDGAGNSGATSKCDPTLPPNSAGCVVTVNVQYVYTLSFPMVASIPLNISSTSQLVISQ